MKKRKIILGVTSMSLLVAPTSALISCNLFKDSSGISAKSDLSFWNYEQYISNESKSLIEKVYGYRTFGDLPTFELELQKENAIGGIGSDYFNAMLAGKGLISKIDFFKLFPVVGDDRSKWASNLETIYTPEVWRLLNSFTLYKLNSEGIAIKYNDANSDGIPDIDENGKLVLWDKKQGFALNKDLDEDGVQDYLWEYMVPYYIQNKVIAYNSKKSFPSASGGMPDNVASILKGDDEIAIQNLFPDKSYAAIFKKLIDWGFKSVVVNDYMRDNMIIGSESLSADQKTTTGNPQDINQGKSQLKSFVDMINNFDEVDYDTDGTSSFSKIMDTINNVKSQYQVALIYNGDAYDANDGTENRVADSVRIIVPKNSSFLLDGIVLWSGVSNDYYETDRFYQVLKNALYVGYNTKGYDNVTKEVVYNNYPAKWNKVYWNYGSDEGVGYTPVFKKIYDYSKYVINAGAKNKVAQFMFSSTENNKDNISTRTLSQQKPNSWLKSWEEYYSQIKSN